MALKPLNSIGGFSVGEIPATVIDGSGNFAGNTANFTGNVTLPNLTVNLALAGNTANFTGNISAGNANLGNLATANFVNVSTNVNVTGTMQAGNVRTDNLFYANGNPWDFQLPGGSNTQIQFNDNGDFGGSTNFTFNKTTDVLTVNGNANINNLGTGQVLASANVTAPQFISNTTTGTAPLLVNSTTVVANLNADLLDGFNTATAATANTVAVRDNNGNISANYFIGNGSQLTGVASAGNLANGNSFVAIPSANGNIVVTVAGNANVVTFTGTGAIVAGTLDVSTNITAANITANTGVFTGNGNGLSSLQGANVVGTLNTTTLGNSSLHVGTTSIALNRPSGPQSLTGITSIDGYAATVSTAAQPNITSVGILTGLDVNGNITAANISANTGVFTGNGAGLTNLVGANVTGTVANATHACTANTVTSSAQSNITSVGTLTGLSVNGGNITLTSGAYVGNGFGLTDIQGSSVSGQVANALVAGTVYTNAQPNITSVGTLSSLAVTGNTTAGNVYANSGTIGAANLTGTLTTAAQPNITSVGTLSSLDVTGNITTSANLVANLIVGKTAGVTITAAGTNQNITLVPTGTGTVDVSAKIISNVATPVASTDVATKGYVDAATEGLHIHAPCAAATPDTLATISSGTVTYNNGTAGVGATLTTTGTYATIDGVNIASVGARILVKNEVNAAHNGIYTYTSSTVLTRASDFDTPTEMAGGDFTFVQQGALYNDTGWVMTDPVVTVGTTNVNWVQFSGAGTYTAGTGLTLNGTQFSITNTAVTAGSYGNGDYVATFTVNAQGQLTAAANTAITANAANLSGTTLNANIVNSSLTSVGTLGSLSVTGNLSSGNANLGNLAVANFFQGDGGLLTNVSASGSLSNGTSNVSIPAVNGNVNTSVNGNANILVVTGTGANVNGYLTTSGNLTSLNANLGNLAAANFVNVASNTITSNLTVNLELAGNTANFSGNVVAQNISANSTVFAANANVTGTTITNVLTVNTAISGNTANFSGNIVVNNATVNLELVGNTANFSGNVVVGNLSTVGSGGNITGANVVSANTFSGNLVATTANVSGNITTGNLTVNTEISGNTANFSGNVVLPNLTVNLALAGNTANFTGNITALNANLGNLAIANYVNVSQVINGNVGNFSGNLTGANLVTTGLANVANLNVTTNVTSNLIPNANVTHNLGNASNRWDTVYVASINATSNVTAANFSTNGNVAIGNSTTVANTVTTVAATANQPIASFSKTGVTGVDYIIKGVDSTGGKYSIAHITAVTDGSNVDYTTYGMVNIGSSTGTLVVTIEGSNITLLVTPSSANTTTWTTQYRLI